MISSAPAAWLTTHRHLLPGGDALDLACGHGRHALWLAKQGWRVTAIDRDGGALRELAEEASRRGLVVTTRLADLEGGSATLSAETFDVIVVVHYLHRPLFSQLLAALRPGGVLVYETFTTAQAARGKPTDPDFLLRPGELAISLARWKCWTRAKGSSTVATSPAWWRESVYELRMLRRCGPVRLDRLRNRLGGDAEVRGAPHHAPVHDEQRLWCFVPDAQPCRDRRGHITVRLHRDERVVRVRSAAVLEVIGQLVERLGAGTAGQAVLEDQHRQRRGFAQQGVHLFDRRQSLNGSRHRSRFRARPARAACRRTCR